MIWKRSSRVLLVIMALSVLMSGVALAVDGLRVDGDGLTAGADNEMEFGEVCPGETPAGKSALVAVIQQNANTNQNFGNGVEVAITRQTITNNDSANGVLSAPEEVGTITLPTDWNTERGNKVSDPVSSTVTLSVPADATEGDYSASIQYQGSGYQADVNGSPTIGNLIRNHDLTVTWTVLADDDPGCGADPWYLEGFHQPVKTMEENALNEIRGGQTVPLKFNVYDGDDVEQTDTTHLNNIVVKRVACPSSETFGPVAVEDTASGGTSLRYADGHFIYNWKTPKATNECYRVTVSLQNGDDELVALFRTR